MVCVFPDEVTPYANTVALMPSMAAATTLLADLVYTCIGAHRLGEWVWGAALPLTFGSKSWTEHMNAG